MPSRVRSSRRRVRRRGRFRLARDRARDSRRPRGRRRRGRTAARRTTSTRRAPKARPARLAVDEALQRAAGRSDVFVAERRPVAQVGIALHRLARPGLLGMGIMSTGLWSVSFSIVTARTRKLLKRLVATPMSRTHYLGSFVLSRLVFLALEVGCACWLQLAGVRRSGAGLAWKLAVVCLVGALAFGGMALLVCSRARTIEAVSGLLNLVMLPMWVLSGVFFASSELSRRDAAVHPGAATDGAHRRTARDCERRTVDCGHCRELATLASGAAFPSCCP